MAIKVTPTRRALQAIGNMIRIPVTGDKEPLQVTPTRAATEARLRKRANGNQSDTHESRNRSTKEERDKGHARLTPTSDSPEPRMMKRKKTTVMTLPGREPQSYAI